MTDTALVAVVAQLDDQFFDVLADLWSGEHAILPIDPRLPQRQVREILERFRPERLVENGSSHTLPDPRPVSREIRAVILTSGTSGTPKAVELALTAFSASWTASSHYLAATTSDVWLCCLPPAHIAGFSVMVRSLLNDKRPLVGTLDDLGSARDATLVSMVPTQLRRSLDEQVDLSQFKAILLGGSRIPSDLVEQASEAGARIVTTYGMTETCGGCVYDGFPLEGTDVRIDPDSRIGIRGEVLFSRYRGDPDLTRQALRGGWFETRDVGFLTEEGRLVVMGRADDVIITGGEKVSAAEIEEIVSAHPAVSDCAAIGMQDREWGEVLALVVVLRPGASVTLDGIRALVKSQTAAYKAPKRLEIVDSIPRSPVGKTDKGKILELFKD